MQKNLEIRDGNKLQCPDGVNRGGAYVNIEQSITKSINSSLTFVIFSAQHAAWHKILVLITQKSKTELLLPPDFLLLLLLLFSRVSRSV